MTLKPCPNCKKDLTTRDVRIIGRQPGIKKTMLLTNCKDCHGTLVAFIQYAIDKPISKGSSKKEVSNG